MLGMFSHASGISIIIACRGSRPESTSASSALSSDAESLNPSWMMGFSASMSYPHTSEPSSGSRARIQFRLPCSVLISPLWASIRNGWARIQFGNVFVLYRWWKTASAVSNLGSLRSR